MGATHMIPHIVPSPRKAPFARLLRLGERIPEPLLTAYEHLGRLDPNWIWVVERDGHMETILVAAPVHGVVCLWRMCSLPGSGTSNILLIVRRLFEDCVIRGYQGYMLNFDADISNEAQIMRIFLKLNGKIAGKGVWIAGRFSDALEIA